MNTWSPEHLEMVGSTDDFHISPYRDDMTTPGTPTSIWSVVVAPIQDEARLQCREAPLPGV